MADTSAQTRVSWQEQVQTGLARAAQRDELPAEIISPVGKYVLAAPEARNEAREREYAVEHAKRVELVGKLFPTETFSIAMAGRREGDAAAVRILAHELGMTGDVRLGDVLERVKLLANAALAP